MKIAVGTKNEAKLSSIRNVFINNTVLSCNAASGVSNQPFSDEETIKGAINRARNALELLNGDIGIGLEGGVHETPYGLMLCNWGALITKDSPDEPIIAGGARIPLPLEISSRLRKGEELGPIMDDFCKSENIRSHEGAVGIFTYNSINRAEMFTHVVLLLKGQLEYRMKKKII